MNAFSKFFKNIKSRWEILPLIAAAGLVPIIMRYYKYDTKLGVMSWYTKSGETEDMFLHYKGVLLLILAVLMVIIAVAGIVRSRERGLFLKKWYWLPLAVYVLMAVLSTIFSKYRYFSLFGLTGQLQSVFILLGYMVVVFYGAYVIRSREDVQFFLTGMGVFVLINALIGVIQLCGVSFVNLPGIKHMILPVDMWERELTDVFGKGRVYMGLYNPNYVGPYVNLLLPVYLTAGLMDKKIVRKVFYFIISACLFLCLLGSISKAGFIALAFSLALLLIFRRRELVKRWKEALIVAACAALMFGGYSIYSSNSLTDAMQDSLTTNKSIPEELESIETRQDGVYITYNGNVLRVQAEYGYNGAMSLVLTDGDGEEVQYSLNGDGTAFVIDDERFPFTISSVTYNSYSCFGVEIDGELWCFSNQTGMDGYYYMNSYGRMTKIETADTAVFTNYDKLLSGRGYIWARTIPLMKDYIVLGSGPDTFATVFPQKDYVAAKRVGFGDVFISRPHSWYLQMAVETGLVSMLAVIIFYIIYAVISIKLYWKTAADSWLGAVGCAFFVAAAGYMITCISNDSMVVTAPVFWAVIGVGTAINELMKRREPEKIND